jgi:hypothetical protein
MSCNSKIKYWVGMRDGKSLLEFRRDYVRMSKGSQEAEQIQQKNGNMVEKACSIVKY